MSNRNLGILKVPIAIQVAHAQLRYLTGAAGNGILMALAAGLRVIKWSETVCDLLYGIEFRPVRLVRSLVHEAIAAVVESGRRF
jgi:hypothetical protein